MICCGVSTPFTNRSVSHRSSVPSRPKIWQKSFNPVYKPVSLTAYPDNIVIWTVKSFNPVYNPVSLTTLLSRSYPPRHTCFNPVYKPVSLTTVPIFSCWKPIGYPVISGACPVCSRRHPSNSPGIAHFFNNSKARRVRLFVFTVFYRYYGIFSHSPPWGRRLFSRSRTY